MQPLKPLVFDPDRKVPVLQEPEEVRARKIDGNHAEIVKALEKAGCSVQSMAAIGCGCPDLLVGLGRMNYAMECQEALILAALLEGEQITPLDALVRWNCFRLGARVHQLKKSGYKILTEMVCDNGKRYARYRMAA